MGNATDVRSMLQGKYLRSWIFLGGKSKGIFVIHGFDPTVLGKERARIGKTSKNPLIDCTILVKLGKLRPL